MSRDDTPTVWEATPHTLAKHAILREYLKAWMPILSRQLSGQKKGAKKVLFIDGFAGSGEYVGGEPGSPIIAVDTALEQSDRFPVPICIVSIEKDQERHSVLSGIIDRRREQIVTKQVEVPSPICADCETEINRFFVKCREQGRQFPPALVFLDQFGYSGVSMDLIGKILEHRSCEVLSFMNWRDLNNYMTDKTKWPGITRAFGGDDWTQVIGLPQGARDRAFLDTYKKALTERGGALYNCHFAMHDINDTLIYWLFFCTSSLRGLEAMKRAMWKVDTTGAFRFSDKHADQLFLLEGFTQDWLADALAEEFAGREVRVSTIRDYVLVDTPCYKYVDALRSLEKADRLVPLEPPQGHRRGTFKKYEDDDPSLTLAFKR